MLDLHYRRAPDPAATVAVLEAEILGPARALGLAVATGHFLVELRPPEPVSKGTAVRRLLRTGGRGGVALRTAIFVGDDLTDCTGFAAVHEWAGETQPVGEARSAARTRTQPAAADGDAPAGASPSPSPPSPTRLRDGSRTRPTSWSPRRRASTTCSRCCSNAVGRL